jgi:hypothetical protein
MDQSVHLWFLDSVYFISYLLDRRYIGWYQYTHGLYSWFCLIWDIMSRNVTLANTVVAKIAGSS